LNNGSSGLLETVRALPKIELHRHLEGSVRLTTLVEIAQQYGIEMPEYDVETLRPFVQMMPTEPRTWQNFLAKFPTLRQFYRSPEIIRRITREAVIDAAEDNVKYMELRFTPKALCSVSQCEMENVVGWVCDTAAETAAEYDIQVRLIVSMNRHESVELGKPVLDYALEFRNRGVVAIDLAGQEAGYSALPFRPVFMRAKAEGLGVTVHAGEWDGAESVWDAVGSLGATRVGHGIRALEDPGIVGILVERGITLEVCPSSNCDSGVVSSLAEHPLPKLHQQGVLTTINTDDPLVSNITLSEEIVRVMSNMGLTLDDMKQHILRAAQAAFLPPSEREALVAKFQQWLAVDNPT
jgi:adenosine deaminase